MRFYYDSHYPGEKRIISKFLWLPKRILNETRWLEKTSWIEEYVLHWDVNFWFAKSWLDHTNFYYKIVNNES